MAVYMVEGRDISQSIMGTDAAGYSVSSLRPTTWRVNHQWRADLRLASAVSTKSSST